MKIQNILMIVFALAILTGCIQQEGNTINVQGDSELTFDPDQAKVVAGISILKSSADEAQTEANRVINAILNGLKSEGISEENIETERLNLYEQKEWRDGKSESVGWRATQTLNIKTEDLGKVGTIVDITVNNGANQINNIMFELSEAKEQEYKKQALSEASKNAKSKAETIADSLGVTLGKIKSVSESNYYARPYIYAMAESVGAKAVDEAATVMPSDVTVTANINIVYYVK
ncbi:hypothetical protein CEE44_01720 [Candidatus Woesearchaeota archaeon B3_Woes]|nr:MAG: hypothetical protein CEE44_01720 [Candidatus Woesearchaeota archaeon B3_Woes]